MVAPTILRPGGMSLTGRLHLRLDAMSFLCYERESELTRAHAPAHDSLGHGAADFACTRAADDAQGQTAWTEQLAAPARGWAVCLPGEPQAASGWEARSLVGQTWGESAESQLDCVLSGEGTHRRTETGDISVITLIAARCSELGGLGQRET